jgi:hypothetical protein
MPLEKNKDERHSKRSVFLYLLPISNKQRINSNHLLTFRVLKKGMSKLQILVRAFYRNVKMAAEHDAINL